MRLSETLLPELDQEIEKYASNWKISRKSF